MLRTAWLGFITNVSTQRQGRDDNEPPRHSHCAVRRQGGRLCLVARRGRRHTAELPGAYIVSGNGATSAATADGREPSTKIDLTQKNAGVNNATSKYQFMEMNLQRRMSGLKDKIPDIQKTLDTVQFMKLRKVLQVHPLLASASADPHRTRANRSRQHSSSTTHYTRAQTFHRQRRFTSGLE